MQKRDLRPSAARLRLAGRWTLGAVLFLVAGCGAAPQAPVRQAQTPKSWGHDRSFDNTGLHGTERDLDQAGRWDHRVIARVAGDPTTRVRAEWDINHDGATDVWQFFGDGGELEQEEMDLDWDGRIDQIVFYENGQIAKKEESTNFDGRMTVRKLYDNQGAISVIEMDTDADEALDTWEFYEAGKLVRIGRDTNKDGREDLFTEPSETYRRQAEEALKAPAAPSPTGGETPSLPASPPATATTPG